MRHFSVQKFKNQILGENQKIRSHFSGPILRFLLFWIFAREKVKKLIFSTFLHAKIKKAKIAKSAKNIIQARILWSR